MKKLIFALLFVCCGARPQLSSSFSSSTTTTPSPMTAIPKYDYRYNVVDDDTLNYMTHEEARDGDDVHGQYTFVDPSGSLVTVDYVAGPMGYSETRTVQKGFIIIDEEESSFGNSAVTGSIRGSSQNAGTSIRGSSGGVTSSIRETINGVTNSIGGATGLIGGTSGFNSGSIIRGSQLSGGSIKTSGISSGSRLSGGSIRTSGISSGTRLSGGSIRASGVNSGSSVSGGSIRTSGINSGSRVSGGTIKTSGIISGSGISGGSTRISSGTFGSSGVTSDFEVSGGSFGSGTKTSDESFTTTKVRVSGGSVGSSTIPVRSNQVVQTESSSSSFDDDLVARIIRELTPFIQQTVSNSITTQERINASG